MFRNNLDDFLQLYFPNRKEILSMSLIKWSRGVPHTNIRTIWSHRFRAKILLKIREKRRFSDFKLYFLL